MTKDFWQKINKLEEVAQRATQEEWLNKLDESIAPHGICVTTEEREKNKMAEIAIIDNALLKWDETWTDFQKEQNANAHFIGAASPALIVEMIAKLRRLEKEADWLADILANDCAGGCGSCVVCGMEDARKGIDCRIMTKDKWRKAARKAVAND